MLQGLDHFTVVTTDLERSLRFYEEVLGLARGDRPDFGFPGHWLYANGHAVVHLLSTAVPRADAGVLDHVAFAAKGLVQFERRLVGAGVAYERRWLPDGSAEQLFLRDPDGARIELVFRSEPQRRTLSG